jgi:hypothetical protein
VKSILDHLWEIGEIELGFYFLFLYVDLNNYMLVT